MAHPEQMAFVREQLLKLTEHFVLRKMRVLEVGSRNVNGSVRDLWRQLLPWPAEYIGLDCAPGPDVDVVCLAHEYSPEPFDMVISCEAFEHDPHYLQTIPHVIRLLKPGGIFIATFASELRPEHGTTRSTPGYVFGPDPNYYHGITLVEFVNLTHNLLQGMEIRQGHNDEDIYVSAFRKDSA